jgi:signal transduction histidine kinase
MEQTELRNDNINLISQRDKFIEIASHEMRTPLTALKAAAQLLGLKHADDDALIAQVNKSVQKLSGLANDMFDSIRLQEHTLDLKRSSTNLKIIVDSSRDHIRLSAKKELIIEGDFNIKITADPEKIERVLINLIQNAVKYATGSTITLRTDKLPGFVKVAVNDLGPGIAPDKLPHIFRRYYRSDPSGIQTGLGLGLYIAAEIIKQHGGEIGVNSAQGQGSSFWFTLPVSI